MKEQLMKFKLSELKSLFELIIVELKTCASKLNKLAQPLTQSRIKFDIN